MRNESPFQTCHSKSDPLNDGLPRFFYGTTGLEMHVRDEDKPDYSKIKIVNYKFCKKKRKLIKIEDNK